MLHTIEVSQKIITNTLLVNEKTKRANLTQMKIIATGLLLVMAAIFILAQIFEQDYPWLRWVNAFSEAAMVGALADWFAVTALFRHPLGIPIPHTAIIPLNKNRVAKSMGNFIQNNFLSEEVLASKMYALDIAGLLTSWCLKQDNSHIVSKEIVSALPEILETLDDRGMQRFLNQNILDFIAQAQVSPLLGHLLKTCTSGNKHQEIVDLLLPFVETVVERHQLYISRAIKNELPWYVPGFIHDRVYKSVVFRLKNTLTQINSNPHHPWCARLQEALDILIEKLISSPYYITRGEEMKTWFLNNPVMKDYLNRVWSEIKVPLIHDVRQENSRIQSALERGIISLAKGLQADNKVREQINQWIHVATKNLVQNHQQEIVSLISDTVSHWDTGTIINKLELEVGRDLQYIRINGTLVGGLAGVVIYALSQLIR